MLTRMPELDSDERFMLSQTCENGSTWTAYAEYAGNHYQHIQLMFSQNTPPFPNTDPNIL